MSIRNLDVRLGRLDVIRNVSLDVEEGRITVIVGANGAVKSTLLRTVAGLDKATRGSILFKGTEIAVQPAHRIAALGISMVPEGRHLFREMTVTENLEIFRAGRSRPCRPRGKVLGGSSSINAMVYIRGQREDYDAWAASGLEGWAYDDVLPCFRKSENNSRGADAFHGAGGGLAVSDIGGDCHPIVEHFCEAARDMGLPLNNDFNGAVQEGVGRYQFNIREGLHSSASNAFLRPAMARTNLTVLTGAQATSFTLEDGRVTGVSFRKDGAACKVSARREVILAAGAINTPQLLTLSGLARRRTCRRPVLP